MYNTGGNLLISGDSFSTNKAVTGTGGTGGVGGNGAGTFGDGAIGGVGSVPSPIAMGGAIAIVASDLTVQPNTNGGVVTASSFLSNSAIGNAGGVGGQGGNGFSGGLGTHGGNGAAAYGGAIGADDLYSTSLGNIYLNGTAANPIVFTDNSIISCAGGTGRGPAGPSERRRFRRQ